MNDFFKNENAHITKIKLGMTIHAIIDGAFAIDKILSGIDPSTRSVILADKNNPAKIKPFNVDSLYVINELDLDKLCDELLAPEEEAMLVLTRISAGNASNGGYGYMSGSPSGPTSTGAGWNVPPGYGMEIIPPDMVFSKKWHPPGCRCKKNKCNGMGGYYEGEPVK
ncbi:hypothetical protein [Pseudomonas sp. SDO52101_S400]